MRVGVVGCGYWGSKHLRVLHGLDEVDQAVAIEPDDVRREELLAAYPGSLGVSSLVDGLDMVDALIIATPAKTHGPLARTALERGKHVMVEKPMATSTAEAAGMAAMADDLGLTLMVGHTFEHHGAVHELKRLVDAGDLGDLRYLSSARLNLGLYQPDINVVWDLAPHDISIANYIVGAMPRSVDCWGWAHASRDQEDVAYVSLDYGEVKAQVHVSWLDPRKVRRVTAVGTDRMVVYDDLDQGSPIRVFDKAVHEPNGQSAGQVRYHDGDDWAPELSYEEPLLVEDRQFIRCALSGERPSTDARSGLAVTATLEAAERSLRLHRRVELEEILHDADALPHAGLIAAPAR
jgi:predicted dehydrogenase